MSKTESETRKALGRPSSGFTLIELMIVVAVVAILAAIAYPSYLEQVRKGNRARAKTVMLDFAQKEERYFTTNNAFCTNSATCTWLANYDGSDKYTIAVTVPGSNSPYDITATPKSSYADPKCGTLTLTALNVKSSTTNNPDCW